MKLLVQSNLGKNIRGKKNHRKKYPKEIKTREKKSTEKMFLEKMTTDKISATTCVEWWANETLGRAFSMVGDP